MTLKRVELPAPTRGLVVAGTHSGVGKTTITLGLLAALRRRGLTVQPFKVGPDFIDPGHHTQAAGRVSRNLDGWMLSRETNLEIFRRHSRAADVALVEGVMGVFDGYDGVSEAGSTAQMAKWLGLPVLLVADARSLARSAAALVLGYATFDPQLHLPGVIFNRIGGETHLKYLQEALSLVEGITCFGGLPRRRELAIPERHLGLTTAADHPLSPPFLNDLAAFLEDHLDLDAIVRVMGTVAGQPAPEKAPPAPIVRLGVAQDQAFCFYYPDNLDWLRRFGAEIVPFSPLTDTALPPDLHGLYLGGGYPELQAARLAENRSMLRAIREQAEAGLPIYGECGGLMYLSRELRDLDDQPFAMVGLLPFTVRMLPRLKALGYREITLTAAGLLGPAGTTARGHEFHYSEIASQTHAPTCLYRLGARRPGPDRAEGYSYRNVLASYVHLHFGSNPQVARHLVAYCRRYKEGT